MKAHLCRRRELGAFQCRTGEVSGFASDLAISLGHSTLNVVPSPPHLFLMETKLVFLRFKIC